MKAAPVDSEEMCFGKDVSVRYLKASTVAQCCMQRCIGTVASGIQGKCITV